MQTKKLLSLLEENPNKSLLFEYVDGHYVGANYHITEVKNITIDAVDCGARTDFWKETIIQLWESPIEKGKREFMTTNKAMGILNKVDRIKPMQIEAEVKFEYGNPNFHTAQLFVNGFILEEDKLIMKLGVEQTDCKARDTCGVPIAKTMQEEVCCSPGGNCC